MTSREHVSSIVWRYGRYGAQSRSSMFAPVIHQGQHNSTSHAEERLLAEECSRRGRLEYLIDRAIKLKGAAWRAQGRPAPLV